MKSVKDWREAIAGCGSAEQVQEIIEELEAKDASDLVGMLLRIAKRTLKRHQQDSSNV